MSSSEEDLKKLKKMKSNVKNWTDWFADNNKNYKEMMRLIYKTTIPEPEKATLKSITKPVIEVNYLGAYIDRLLGEFSHQTPAVSVSGGTFSPQGSSKVSSDVVEIVEKAVMAILATYDKYSKNRVLQQQCVGGFSAFKVYPEYRNKNTFDQDLFLEDCEPTLCFFDSLAKTPSKADGKYAGEFFPMHIDELKNKYPEHAKDIDELEVSDNDNFNWCFSQNDEKIVILCDYYEKEFKNYELLLLSDGNSMPTKEYNKLKKSWSSIEPLPEVVSRRRVPDFQIIRYLFIGNKILKVEKLTYPKLPYFFVDGNSGSVYPEGSDKSKQETKSYAKHGIGPQKLLNSAVQSLADGLQNRMRALMLIEHETIVNPDAWNNIQRATHLQWNSLAPDGVTRLPKPEPIQQPEISPIVIQIIGMMQSIMQNSLGTYDAQLGISDTQLSGVAIEKGATQNNAVSIPYAQNYMLALTDAIDFCVKILPSIHKRGAMLPIRDKEGNQDYVKVNQLAPDGRFDPQYPQINYEHDDLQVNIKADYSFELQKDRALKTMIAMMNAGGEAYKAVMQTPEAMDAFFDNLDMRSVDKVREGKDRLVKQEQMQAQQQAQQQSQQNNPVEIKLQLEQQKLALEQQELLQKQQKEMRDYELSLKNLELEQQKLEQQSTRDLLELRQANISNELAEERMATERETHEMDDLTKLADHDIKLQNQEIKHAEHMMKVDKHLHARNKSEKDTQGKEANP